MQGVVVNRPSVNHVLLGTSERMGGPAGSSCSFECFCLQRYTRKKILPAFRSLKLNTVYAWDIDLL